MNGSVVKKNNNWYVIIERRDPATGKRKRQWHSGFKTKREAEAARTDLLSRIQRGIYIEPSATTVADFLTVWLESINASVRPSTRTSYRAMMTNHVIPRLGNRRLQEITPADLNALYSHLLNAGRVDGKGGLSARSVRYVHSVVHHALSDAVRWDLTPRNVAALATPPRGNAWPRDERRTWSADEVAAFLHHTADQRLSAVWVLAATTGMRRGELLGLQWGDIDFERRVLAVRRSLVSIDYEVQFSAPKTERSRRSVSLDATTVAALVSHRRSQAAERLAFGPAYENSDLVFCREDGTPVHPDRLTKVFNGLVLTAGLPRIRLHDLRHTHATLALQAGIHPKVVSERLGHSTVAMTLDTYSHAVPSMQADAADLVAELVFGSKR